jgi:phenylpropionate dioxygenase-like ring-hydroxylating dioxygenase large terminal subunit
MNSEKPGSAFVLDNWYVVGLSADIAATPLARRICNLPMLFYRTEAGEVVALADRCAHRGMPLSKGERSGDNIRCIYHGLEFNSAGACVKIPGQERIPTSLRVRSYPVVEKDALVWVWTGDPAKADATLIVSHPYHTDPAWVWTRGAIEVNANWQLLNDNLLDLSHLQYVHKKTIGGNPEEDQKAEVKAARVGNTVMITRWLCDMDAPPFHRQLQDLPDGSTDGRRSSFVQAYWSSTPGLWMQIRARLMASALAGCISAIFTPSRPRRNIRPATCSRSPTTSRPRTLASPRRCTSSRS